MGVSAYATPSSHGAYYPHPASLDMNSSVHNTGLHTLAHQPTGAHSAAHTARPPTGIESYNQTGLHRMCL